MDTLHDAIDEPPVTPERTPRPERRSRRAVQGATASCRTPSSEPFDPANLKNHLLYVNRELSWLEFNERVLAQARDTSHPLLERIKFLAITATNLDEFFMIRVATTLKKLREGIEDVAPDGYNTRAAARGDAASRLRMLQDQVEVLDELRDAAGRRTHHLPRERRLDAGGARLPERLFLCARSARC